MSRPVSYLEIQSPDLAASTGFFTEVFGWAPQPFAAPDYLVAPHGEAPGVDTGLMPSRDGQPRSVPVIRVPDLDAVLEATAANGGAVVVPPFAIGGVGRGAYVTDPAGVLIGVHMYDPGA
ncbi:VOC family protein [Actinoplanes sp. CA-030573]|uniref:VOC family protein n=1 Tax=Actinoplanes sp. CA-030573 TaxID=3239898 RepID=UPI003D932FC8